MSRKAALTFILLFSLTGVHAGTYSGGDGNRVVGDFVKNKGTEGGDRASKLV